MLTADERGGIEPITVTVTRKHGEWFQDMPKLRQFIARVLAARGLPVDG